MKRKFILALCTLGMFTLSGGYHVVMAQADAAEETALEDETTGADEKSEEEQAKEDTEKGRAGRVEMNRHKRNQDRNITWLACITMLITAGCIKIYGYGSIGGGLLAGAFLAFIPIGFYLLIKNRKDPAGRKVYSLFILFGMLLALLLFTYLNVDRLFLLWGSFLLFSILIGILND